MKQLIFKRVNLLFFLCLGFFMLSALFETTAWASRQSHTLNAIAFVLKVMRYVAYALCAFIILDRRCYRKKDLFIFMLVIIGLALSLVGSQSNKLFLYLFIIIAASKIDGEKIIRGTLVIQTFVIILVIFSSSVGIIPDYYSSTDGRIRHYLGFGYTSTGPVLFYYMVLQYIYIKKGKLKILQGFVILAIAALFYQKTNTLFAFLMSATTVIIFLFYARLFDGSFFRKHITFISLLPFVFLVISLLFAALYDNSSAFWYTFNYLTHGRLKAASEGLLNYGISMFGNEIDWIGHNLYSLLHGLRGKYNYIDISYLQLLFQYGLVATVLILVGYLILLRKSILSKKYYFTWIIILILVHALFEPFLANLAFNPFLLLILTQFEKKDKYCLASTEIDTITHNDYLCRTLKNTRV